MARDFDGVDDKANFNGAILSGVPMTLAAWFRCDNIDALQAIIGVSREGVSSRFQLFAHGAGAGDPVLAQTLEGGVGANASTSTGYSAGVWHHGAAVFAAANDRRAYIDGGSKGTEATSVTPTLLDRTTAGASGSATTGSFDYFFDGRIAEGAIWNVALSDNEVAALARGVCPLLIRPLNLVGYWPIWGDDSPEPDWHPRSSDATGRVLTLTGTTKANHAPATLWFPPQTLVEEEVASGQPAMRRFGGVRHGREVIGAEGVGVF